MELLIHVIIGASKYAQNKAKRNIMIENRGEPVAEDTASEWAIISGVRETTQNHMLLTKSKETACAELCQLDVLVQEEPKSNNKSKIYQEFKDQLGRSQEGWYETSPLWKTNSDDLSANKAGSLARLSVLLRKLK